MSALCQKRTFIFVNMYFLSRYKKLWLGFLTAIQNLRIKLTSLNLLFIRQPL